MYFRRKLLNFFACICESGFFFLDQAGNGAIEDNLKCRKALARLYKTAYSLFAPHLKYLIAFRQST
jgi:hypothetical protein